MIFTIRNAVEVLEVGTVKDLTYRQSDLRAECGDCMGMVGQAIWDCGTLDIDCIK